MSKKVNHFAVKMPLFETSWLNVTYGPNICKCLKSIEKKTGVKLDCNRNHDAAYLALQSSQIGVIFETEKGKIDQGKLIHELLHVVKDALHSRGFEKIDEELECYFLEALYNKVSKALKKRKVL